MSKKRNKWQIIYDILKAIQDKDNILHTHILYKANLSYPILEQYLRELIFKEMVVERRSYKKKRTYVLTDKGFEYMRKFGVINEFNRFFNLEEPQEAV